MPAVHFYCILCGAALQTSSDSGYNLMQCDHCSRHVPVPKPVSGLGDFTRYAPVFPPEVLELLVKFQCAACDRVLYVDARYEGREVACPDCDARTGVPRWSDVPSWPHPSEMSGKTRLRTTPSRSAMKAPTLSEEEIDFLRGEESNKPAAAVRTG